MKRHEQSPKLTRMDNELQKLEQNGDHLAADRKAEEMAFKKAWEEMKKDIENPQVYLEKTRCFAVPLEDRIQEIYRIEGEERARAFSRNCTGPKTGDEIFKMAIANLPHNKDKLRGY